MTKKSIVIICILAIIIVFLSMGEHENGSLNEILAKIGLKISHTERIEKSDSEKSTIGISSRYNYHTIITFGPNYFSCIAYISIIGILISTLDRKVV